MERPSYQSEKSRYNLRDSGRRRRRICKCGRLAVFPQAFSEPEASREGGRFASSKFFRFAEFSLWRESFENSFSSKHVDSVPYRSVRRRRRAFHDSWQRTVIAAIELTSEKETTVAGCSARSLFNVFCWFVHSALQQPLSTRHLLWPGIVQLSSGLWGPHLQFPYVAASLAAVRFLFGVLVDPLPLPLSLSVVVKCSNFYAFFIFLPQHLRNPICATAVLASRESVFLPLSFPTFTLRVEQYYTVSAKLSNHNVAETSSPLNHISRNPSFLLCSVPARNVGIEL